MQIIISRAMTVSKVTIRRRKYDLPLNSSHSWSFGSRYSMYSIFSYTQGEEQRLEACGPVRRQYVDELPRLRSAPSISADIISVTRRRRRRMDARYSCTEPRPPPRRHDIPNLRRGASLIGAGGPSLGNNQRLLGMDSECGHCLVGMECECGQRLLGMDAECGQCLLGMECECGQRLLGMASESGRCLQ